MDGVRLPLHATCMTNNGDIDWEAWGFRLRAAREDAHLTLEHVADELGTTPQALAHYEKGRRKVEPHTVFALETAIGLRPGELSRFLGYMPVDTESVPDCTVTDALAADPALTTRARQLLRDTYREFLETR